MEGNLLAADSLSPFPHQLRSIVAKQIDMGKWGVAAIINAIIEDTMKQQKKMKASHKRRDTK